MGNIVTFICGNVSYLRCPGGERYPPFPYLGPKGFHSEADPERENAFSVEPLQITAIS